MSFASAMDIPDEPFKKKRRKGGIRQRLAAEETEASSTAKSFSSELGTSLVERWAWGTMSPQEVLLPHTTLFSFLPWELQVLISPLDPKPWHVFLGGLLKLFFWFLCV